MRKQGRADTVPRIKEGPDERGGRRLLPEVNVFQFVSFGTLYGRNPVGVDWNPTAEIRDCCRISAPVEYGLLIHLEIGLLNFAMRDRGSLHSECFTRPLSHPRS